MLQGMLKAEAGTARDCLGPRLLKLKSLKVPGHPNSALAVAGSGV